MRSLLAFIILAALGRTPAHAAQCGGEGPILKDAALCSKTFEFQGICGHPNYKFKDWESVAIAVGAWEHVPIRIMIASTEAIIVANRAQITAKIFVGNSFNADLMTPEQSAMSSPINVFVRLVSRIGLISTANNVAVKSEEHFADVGGMQFPAGRPMFDAHIDVHLFCSPSGASYSGSLSLWYRLDP